MSRKISWNISCARAPPICGNDHSIAVWFAFTTAELPHQALGNTTPTAIWCDGTTGALIDNAVGMMDNAKGVAQMPTAAITRPALCYGRRTEVKWETEAAENQLSKSISKPSDGVQVRYTREKGGAEAVPISPDISTNR